MKIDNDNGNGGLDNIKTKGNALTNYHKLLNSSHLPGVLSSYLSTSRLPAKYKEIDDYVVHVRANLLNDINHSPTQLQMMMLDGICETLILTKYIAAWISEDPGTHIIDTAKADIHKIVSKGYHSFQVLLDKKIKQFHDMVNDGSEAHVSASDAHAMALMKTDSRKNGENGERHKTGRPLGSQKKKEQIIDKFSKLEKDLDSAVADTD